MKKEDAEKLVKKFEDAVFIAGKYSGNPKSLLCGSETRKAILLRDEILRHLIAHAADKRKLCKICGGNLIDGTCYDCLGDGGCR